MTEEEKTPDAATAEDGNNDNNDNDKDDEQQQQQQQQQRICNMTAETNASRRKAGGTDPYAQEKKLRELLTNAEDIESIDHFVYWKDTFLTEFRHFCDPDGTATAREADEALYLNMETLGKQCLKVKELCKTGGITENHCTVKGQNALNEMIAMMAKTENDIKEFMPKTSEDEEKVGYTKFELAAVLIKDAFRVYGIMIVTRDYILALTEEGKGPLAKGDILRVNSKSIMNFYLKSIDSFCDTMADLGMKRLMEKCVDMYSIRPRNKKKKAFVRRPDKDPLSDTTDDELPNKGKMFQKPKKNFKAVMDNGWTSGVSGQEFKAPKGSKRLSVGDTWGKDDIEAAAKDVKKEVKDYIYYLDPVTEKVGKILRNTCIQEKMVVTVEGDGKEVQEGRVEEWDGKEGQAMMIWKFKEILKGKSLKEKPK